MNIENRQAYFRRKIENFHLELYHQNKMSPQQQIVVNFRRFPDRKRINSLHALSLRIQIFAKKPKAIVSLGRISTLCVTAKDAVRFFIETKTSIALSLCIYCHPANKERFMRTLHCLKGG